jgi:hypothetical protein
MRLRNVVVTVVALAAVLLVLLTAYLLVPHTPALSIPACGASAGLTLYSTNITPDLPRSFSQGAIQAFGSNSSGVIFGGVSYYDRNHLPYDSLPALGSYSPATATANDLTAQTSSYFFEGGVFPVGWNGTAWLIAGQTTIGNVTEGSAIALQGGHITNLTPIVAPYFQQQGIWIAGWDGEGWLLGGNDTQGAVLVYLQGDSATDLTSLLPNNRPGDWIQALGWNGTGWLVGGQGIFGAYEGGRFTNLLPSSPFTGGAVLSMDWNGSSWLVGGSPLALAYVHGNAVLTAPPPATGTVGWVNSIVAIRGEGWVVAGGTDSGGQYSPILATLPSRPGTTHPVDDSSCLPGAFTGGWVQYGALAPAFGSNQVLLVGQGGTVASTFASHAAAVVLSVEDNS